MKWAQADHLPSFPLEADVFTYYVNYIIRLLHPTDDSVVI
jgi:hypothetical protein